MKKILGILGVAVIAATMFFSSNNMSTTEDTSLAGLIALNAANAETTVTTGCAKSNDSTCIDQTDGKSYSNCMSNSDGSC
ncbi:hypothetical protein [Flavobacterium magnesitis]|uniref:hypothetical protein n=1 Tax=Flavobacterium magnesitis TaxID=3138077 RepID=UPI00358E4DF3